MKTYLLAATLLLAACGQNSASETSASAAENLTTVPDSNDVAVDTEVVTNGTVASVPTTAAEFANAAAAADQFEIKSSQLAATKAGSAGVKSFAAMLLTEHTKSTADLTAAAAQAAPAIVPAASLTAEQQANLDALAKAPKGAAFDTLYAQLQVPAHENALALMQGYAARGDQVQLKVFASQTATSIKKHLEQARGLAK